MLYNKKRIYKFFIKLPSQVALYYYINISLININIWYLVFGIILQII